MREQTRGFERLISDLETSMAQVDNHINDTPGLHNEIPAQKIFARGWVAQKSLFSQVVAKIFQGLGPKRRESSNGDRVQYNDSDTTNTSTSNNDDTTNTDTTTNNNDNHNDNNNDSNINISINIDTYIDIDISTNHSNTSNTNK